MEYFDFIKPGELENLPEDPQLAFSLFVQLAQPRLVARLEQLDSNNQDDWSLLQDARYGFQNVVLGAARKFGIEPFSSAELPLVKNYNEEDYRQFRADLSHYITQIMLTAADYDRSASVPLLDQTKESIRTYIYHLRLAIDRVDLPEATRARLHKRLDELEQELSRRRVRFVVVASVMMAILAAPGELTGSYDAVVRITNCIMREFGEAKARDDEQRHISADEPVALLPPRTKQEPEKIIASDQDDEIPF